MPNKINHDKKYGYTKKSNVPAMRVALPVGFLTALTLGLIKVIIFNRNGPYKWIGGIILGGCLTPAFVAMVWLAIVDRKSLPGAVSDPDNSVESSWYNQAISDSFHTTLGTIGVALFVVSTFSIHRVEIDQVLLGVLLVMGISFSVSYLIRRLRS